jgi:hypothetical protein
MGKKKNMEKRNKTKKTKKIQKTKWNLFITLGFRV